MYEHFFKKILDFLAALILLPCLFVLVLLVAIAIKIEDRGPVFYTANRLGKNEQVYKMYKFRTMKVNAPDFRNVDGSTKVTENDNRLLKVGKVLRKLSIDEVPQLLNVLTGKMSIVGPRPDLPESIKFYKKSQIKKLDVRPGITGLTQAYYRNSIEQNNKFDMDAKYAEEISFLLDTKIIIKTIKTVFLKENIYKNENYGN